MTAPYGRGRAGNLAAADALDKKLQPEAQAGVFGAKSAPGYTASPGMPTTSDRSALGSAAGMAGYYHDDNPEADTQMAYRLAAAGSTNTPGLSAGGALPADLHKNVPELRNFKVELQPGDIDYFEKRRKEQQAADFDAWVSRRIDMADPAESRWLQTIHPEFWARREAFIDDKINIEARMAKLALRGVKTKEDLLFLYAVDNGYLTPSRYPLFRSEAHRAGAYRQGWLSLFGATQDSNGYAMNQSLGEGALTANATQVIGERTQRDADPMRYAKPVNQIFS